MSEQLTEETLPADEAPDDDMKPIAALIEAATPHGLLLEAIWSYTHALRGGSSIWDAVNHAIREWDL